jgi:hypothetical protein
MTERPQRHPMTLQPAVLKLLGMEAAMVRRGVVYRNTDAGGLALNVWSPPGTERELRPAVVFVSGFPDPGFEQRVGCKVLEMASYESWARLLTTCGLRAVTYDNHEPAADFLAALGHVHEHAAELGVDRRRIAIWACSGNVPTALSALISGTTVPVVAAALLYGYMLGAGAFAAQIGFADPCARYTVEDVKPGVSLLVVRAGKDQTPGLNDTVDRFVAGALARDLPLTLVNRAGAAHAFDISEDSEASREAIRGVLHFFRTALA